MINSNITKTNPSVNSQPMMSSREIADLLGKRHSDVMRDIRGMLAELEQNADLRSAYELSSYVGTNGQNYPQYKLNKDLTLTLTLGYDVAARFKLVQRWQELEAQEHRALLAEKVSAELMIAEAAIRVLRPAPSGQLLMISNIATNNGLDASFLPSYGVDAPSDSTAGSSEPTAPITRLLKEHGISTRAIDYNKLLGDAGMLERLSRPKKKGGTQSYWSVTEKGLQYGKNVTNQYNQLETQPHWYVGRFEALHNEVMALAGEGNE